MSEYNVPNRHSQRLQSVLIESISDFTEDFEMTKTEVIGVLSIIKSLYTKQLFEMEENEE